MTERANDPLLPSIARHWFLLLLIPAVVAVVVFFAARTLPAGYAAEVRVPVDRATAMSITRSMALPSGVAVSIADDSTTFVARGSAPEGLVKTVLSAAQQLGLRANEVFAQATLQDRQTLELLRPFFDALKEGNPNNPAIAQAVIALNNQILAAERNIARAGTPLAIPTEASTFAERRDALGLAVVSWFAATFLATLLVLHLSDRRQARKTREIPD